MPTDIKKRASVKQSIKIVGRTSLRIVDKSIRVTDKTLRGTEHVKRTVNRNMQHAKDVYENSQENVSEYGQKKITETSEYVANKVRIASSEVAAKAIRKAATSKPDIVGAVTTGAGKIKTAHTTIRTAKSSLRTAKNTNQAKSLIRKAQKEMFQANKEAVRTIGKVVMQIAKESVKFIAKGAALFLGSAGIAILLICSILFGGVFIYMSTARENSTPQPMIANAIYYFLRTEVGLNPAAACGVVANIEVESAGFNITAVGDYGTSFGMCQWHNERWDRLNNFCAENGYDPSSLIGQLEYLYWELQFAGYDYVLDFLLNVENTPIGCYDAASYFCKEFERPHEIELEADKRGISAMQNYWSTYGMHEANGDWTEQGMQLAMTAYKELGNGGTKYWSWYGFPNRVEWCAIFVSWCAGQNGYIDSDIMPMSANVDNAQSGYQWYYNHARVEVAAPDVEPAPGWVAFFGRGHTGIVFAVSDGQVYLVEGNSGDSVNLNSYSLDTIRNDIWGFGVPNYTY